jgi:hypothetical protein
MKTFAFTAAVAAAGLIFSVASVEAASLSQQVRGTSWKLVSLTLMPPNGSPVHPQGTNPTGYTIFDRTGHFIVVSSNPDVPKFASDNLLKGTDAEYRSASLGTVVQFGTYKVDDKKHTLIFHLEGSNYPNWIGTDLHTPTELKGNRLTWTSSSGAAKVPVVVIWERVH